MTKLVVEFPATVASEKLDADCRSVVVGVVDGDVVDVVDVVFGDKFVVFGAVDAWESDGDDVIFVVVVVGISLVVVVAVVVVGVVVDVVVDVVVVGTFVVVVVVIVVVADGKVVGSEDSNTTSIQ